MLRPAGYFRHFSCPFDTRGCQRPYCQYRHKSGRRVHPFHPQQRQPLSGSPSLAGLGKNIQELERINKAIQSVKTEVEEGQKELLCYNLGQDDFRNTLTPAIDDPEGNRCFSDEGHLSSTLTKDNVNVISTLKDSYKSSKYTLDRSRPATDLEYDPLLNYSSGLLRSSFKEEDKNDRQQVKIFSGGNLQGSTIKAPCENRYRFPRKRSRSSSPIKLEIKLQETDDDVLVIDAPLVNVSKKPRIIKSCKKWKKVENELSFGSKAEALKSSEKSKSSYCIEGRKLEDITVALDNDRKNNKKETGIKYATNENFYFPNVVHVTTSNEESNPDDQREHHIMEKINILSQSQMKGELKKETLKQNSVNISIKTSNMKEQMNNCKTLLNKAQTKTYSKDRSQAGVIDISKKSSDHLGTLQSLQRYEKSKVQNNAQSSPVNLDGKIHFYESPDKKHNDKSVYANIKEDEIIVLDSSGEDDSEEDTELSDDTMEECQKIFNEFVECEVQKEEIAKQALAAQPEADSDSKASLLPGQKRRIAHTAKFDVSTTKEIIVPFKARLPQQPYHSRILQAQQQAVQITAAVKSGQAFVAAACGSRKSAPVIPTTQIQNMEPMVHLNVFEVQPVSSSSSHMKVLLPGSALTAMPCRLSSNSIGRTASIPSKVSSRKRPSVVPELGSKVPHDIRQRYVNFFVEGFLKVCTTVNEAFDKALAEEKAIYDRCSGKNIYLNIAVNTLKKLRNHSSVSSDGKSYFVGRGKFESTTAGFRKQEEKNDFTGIALYRLLKDYALTEEQLKENGYPEPNPEKPGSAILCSGRVKPAVYDSSRRVCCRCGKTYSVNSSGKHVRKEECNYHSGRILRHKVPGGLETRYSCCEGVVGSPGCQVAKLHVHDGRRENIDGFVKTFIKPPPLGGNHGVFALDCEMCYTTRGLELSRVTIVDPSLQVVYDTVVKPDNEVIDYNNRFSGVTAEDMENTGTSIRDVQAVLLNLFSADSILIGYGLESDLFALKFFHSNVVDTSVVFPHRLGFPHKRALRNLIADYLRRIIQDDVGGHDSSEDATACMELMLWKVREDSKGRR
ncbi:PREDICTED: RNA exonuclease 1 homolog [Gekko japonicus]|uniref:RNA exonuclease 1 homolog n=1 Tax=Gekko japonicus TaxID=146911 RepID=A0ABM1KIU7_GEKJA|nr:PREDICTED: RNA exonuclease 1 homolog [Gekko japonicus]